MSALPTHASALPRLDVDYTDTALPALLADDAVLAVFGFGPRAPVSGDPRYLRVALEPTGTAPLEVWRGHAPVRCGRDGAVAWSDDGALLFASMELDEDALAGDARDDDIERAAQAAYARLSAFVAARGYPHLLRMWNYLDGITAGEGDAERYRRFCVGRAQGLGSFDPHALPAATAIGRVDGVRRLQVYLLAARVPGTPLENPRQVSAFLYPGEYGPRSPTFSRAALVYPPGQELLFVSGTASIVGHQSVHRGDVAAQTRESLDNIEAVLAEAQRLSPQGAFALADLSYRVYIRHAADLGVVRAEMAGRVASAETLYLQADVCRSELLVEIEAQGLRATQAA